MSDITIVVPPAIVQAFRLPPETIQAELQQELALALYQRGILSSSIACNLAGITRWEWEALLGERKIPRHYADDELERDIVHMPQAVSNSSPLIHLSAIGRLCLLKHFSSIIIPPAVWHEGVVEGGYTPGSNRDPTGPRFRMDLCHGAGKH